MEKIKKADEETVLLRGTAGDDLSGLAEEAFSWNKGYSYGKESCLEVKENGIYQLTVRDKAGNWRYKQIKVDCFQEKEKKIIPPKTVVKKEKKIQNSVSENRIEKKEIKLEKKAPVEKKDEIQKEIHQDFVWFKIFMIMGFLFLFILFLLFFLLNPLVLIYGRNQETYRLIGMTRMKKEENAFLITITDACVAACVENEMMLKPTGFFVSKHKDEILNILLPEEQSILKSIEKEIYFDLMY